MAASIVLSFASWGLLLSWKFAFVIAAVLVVHEGGHAYVAKRFKLKVVGVYGIPFFGAAVAINRKIASQKARAYVAFGGPAAGAIMAILCAVVFLVTNSTLFAGIAGVTAYINLFNLIPIWMLDGRKIVDVISSAYGPGIRTSSLAFTAGLAGVTFVLAGTTAWFVVFCVALFELQKRTVSQSDTSQPAITRADASAVLNASLGLFLVLGGLSVWLITSNHGVIGLLHIIGG